MLVPAQGAGASTARCAPLQVSLVTYHAQYVSSLALHTHSWPFGSHQDLPAQVWACAMPLAFTSLDGDAIRRWNLIASLLLLKKRSPPAPL